MPRRIATARPLSAPHAMLWGNGSPTAAATTAATATTAAVMLVALTAATPPAQAFPSPLTFDPLNDVESTVTVGSSVTHKLGRELVFNNGIPSLIDHPEILWYEYESDGVTPVQFDMEGTNISTLGPHQGYTDGNYASLGFGTYDQTQMALYNSSGQLMGVSIGWYDEQGYTRLKRDFVDGPIIYVRPSDGLEVDFSDVVTHGLARLVFTTGASGNPRWNADPNDPTPANPDQPGYDTLNDYELWDTAIDDAINTTNGWRAGDRARYGPGARWDTYDLLPAGTYYVAITTGAVSFSGDQYVEEILQAPIHYDNDTQTDDVPVLTSDMGPFQYYLAPENPSFPYQYGTVQLNVSTYNPIPQPVSVALLAPLAMLGGRRRRVSR